MKNITSLFSVLFFLSLIISSCSRQPGISITKRHYRDGYHVELNSGKLKKSERTETKKEELSRPARAEEQVAIADEEIAAEKDESEAVKPGNSDENELKSAAKENESVKPVFKKKGLIEQSTASVKRFIRKPAISSAFKNNSNTASENDGGGLLWTLIAILIVLWLIGLLTGGWGLGGLIYIFLVVALILLLIKLIARI